MVKQKRKHNAKTDVNGNEALRVALPLAVQMERRFIERCEKIGMPFSDLTGDETRLWECAIATLKEFGLKASGNDR